MTVYCDRRDCANNSYGCECEARFIFLNDGDCEEYESYTHLDEYQSEYTIRVRCDGGTVARAKKHGKKIELCGLTFFTDTHPREIKLQLTDSITGLSCGTPQYIKEQFESFITAREKYIKENPVLDELPLAKYDEAQHKYVILEG